MIHISRGEKYENGQKNNNIKYDIIHKWIHNIFYYHAEPIKNGDRKI